MIDNGIAVAAIVYSMISLTVISKPTTYTITNTPTNNVLQFALYRSELDWGILNWISSSSRLLWCGHSICCLAGWLADTESLLLLAQSVSQPEAFFFCCFEGNMLYFSFLFIHSYWLVGGGWSPIHLLLILPPPDMAHKYSASEGTWGTC